MPDRRAFIAGATGYTGRALVPVLRDRGFDVVAHVRSESAHAATLGPAFLGYGATLDDTPWDSDAWPAMFRRRRPSHVFALLGTTGKRARGEGMRPAEAYEAVDYGLTLKLLTTLVESAVEARFIYLSAAGVRSDSTNPYLRARARIEEALGHTPLPWTVVRPSFITGDRDESRPVETAGARVADGVLAVAAVLGAQRFRERYRSRTAHAWAEILADAAQDPNAVGCLVYGDGVDADPQGGVR